MHSRASFQSGSIMKRCLVIDDSDVIRKIAGHVFRSLDFDVSEAENGRDALEKCQAQMPDVILLDWHMPVMGSMEFLAALRPAHQARKPHILYCTTENDPVDIARALSSGADDYIMKPYDGDGLAAKLQAAGLLE
jgi:two-component system chemotaxis response regulator CheY